MEYGMLGRSGLKVSRLCLGTMQFGWTADEKTSMEVLSAAFDAGINFFDSADIYSRWVEGNEGGEAERILGSWIREEGIPRDQLVLATKVRGPMGTDPNQAGLSGKHILEAADASLERLGTDHIDLYQLHFPDEDSPIEETLSALGDLMKSGRVRYLGCSNFSAWQLVEALWASDVGGYPSFISLQPHYNLVHRQEFEGDLEAVCGRYGLGVIPYSPLAGGFLTDKYERGKAPPQGSRGATSSRVRSYMAEEKNWKLHDRLRRLGDARGKTVSQMALAWLLSRPIVSAPIIGPRNREQLEDNLGADSLQLTTEELESLGAAGSGWAPSECVV